MKRGLDLISAGGGTIIGGGNCRLDGAKMHMEK